METGNDNQPSSLTESNETIDANAPINTLPGDDIYGTAVTPVEEKAPPVVDDNEADRNPPVEGDEPTEDKPTEDEPSEDQPSENKDNPPATDDNPDEDSEPTQEELDSYANEMSGGVFDTYEKFQESKIFEKFKDFEKVNTRNEELTEEVSELKLREPEFANDLVKGLNDWVKKGGDAKEYLSVQSSNWDEASPEDIMFHQVKKDHPTLSEDEVKAHISRKYKTDKEKYTEDEVSDGQLDLKMDADKARADLKAAQVSMDVPDAEKARLKDTADETARMESFTPKINEAINNMETVSFDINDHEFNYVVDEADKAEILKDVSDIIQHAGTEFTPENVEMIKEVAENRFKLKHFSSIMSAAVEKARSISDEEWLKKSNNPSALKVDEPDPVEDTGDKSLGDIAWARFGPGGNG